MAEDVLARRYIFVDLDDTLFQTRRKCAHEPNPRAAAYLADGSAHSFMTARQRAFWDFLAGQATLIPTTARNQASFARVDLPFTSWRILDYGGIILDHQGEPEPDWIARTTAGARACINQLGELLDQAEALIARERLALRVRIIEDFGLPLYWVAKYRDDRAADLDRLQRELVTPWVAAHAGAHRLHRNENNLAVIPAYLGKEFAVRHLIEQLRRECGDILTIGVGDSLIDAPFMAECDYAIIPEGTQLFASTLATRAARALTP
ncbi:mannosyl-3-phosphoglycerate phosphatase family protein [Thiorhodovibrio winogradskyi]|uniref:Mannosyl-3-phosphoglycerate phosphatase family protein n=1 Tax=Thiorhodovibrio winogradskyi TaxID=77007 RepID=A0ABZ0SG53_9GAMM|nr:haloacid dehalogenase [Thiorhodovibrio winogradskyi]